MTPLLLNSELPGRAVKLEEEGPVGLGMVDELDDPKPGHTSESPKPLTIAAGAKPFLGSLQDRFVKAEASDDTKVQEESAAKKPKLEPKEAEDSKMDQDSESKP
jgi:serine/threonine-protein phosphatase 4 regulatory subunit 2